MPDLDAGPVGRADRREVRQRRVRQSRPELSDQCTDLDTDKPVPCFSDPKGNTRGRDIAARVYTANQGADQWHVLYAWRREGSLYAISEHVTPPYSYARVVRNLNRMLTHLVIVPPKS